MISKVIRFSVVIPVYNAAHFLSACLQSIQSQTYTEWEAICVDDGSNDSSGLILDLFAKKDSRFKVFHRKNSGAGRARNFGIEQSIGNYVCFMDADDLYPSDTVLEKIAGAITRSSAKIVGGCWDQLFPSGLICKYTSPQSKFRFKRENIVSFADYQFDYGFYRFAYARTLLGDDIRFPETSRYEDPLFMVLAFARAGVFCGLPIVTYRYRVGTHTTDWYGNAGRNIKLTIRGMNAELDLCDRYQLENLRRVVSRRIKTELFPLFVLNVDVACCDLFNSLCSRAGIRKFGLLERVAFKVEKLCELLGIVITSGWDCGKERYLIYDRNRKRKW